MNSVKVAFLTIFYEMRQNICRTISRLLLLLLLLFCKFGQNGIKCFVSSEMCIPHFNLNLEKLRMLVLAIQLTLGHIG